MLENQISIKFHDVHKKLKIHPEVLFVYVSHVPLLGEYGVTPQAPEQAREVTDHNTRFAGIVDLKDRP